MNVKTIYPSSVDGTIKAPASKSMMQRAIAIATLAKGTSVIHGYTPSNDSDAALVIAHALGAEVNKEGEKIIIRGGLNPRTQNLNCGESGLGIRMFTPIASLCNIPITLQGEGSLKTRPVSMVEQPLRDLGVSVKTNNGFVPVEVCGPIRGGISHVDGSLSSQVLTGLLIASPLAKKDTTINVGKLKSKPYIDMTLQIMKDFGVLVSQTFYENFFIRGNQTYEAREYTVEGDWSGAAFVLVAGALGGSVTVENIQSNSKQADAAILKAIRKSGAIVSIVEDSVSVTKKDLHAFEFDATECPDLFPPLTALAAHCKGVTEIKGASRLKHKESDRASTLQTEFAKVGTKIVTEGDTMLIYGGTLSGGKMNSNNDHRIAMAGGVAAIMSQKPVEIENPECVAKSYPDFFEDLKKVYKL